MKICIKCNKELEETCFNRYSRAKDGLQSYCRVCQFIEGQKHRELIGTKLLTEKRMHWRSSNKDKDKVSFKKWRKNHPENARNYKIRLRLRAMKKVSSDIACVRCGCDKCELLEINHKNGGGRKETKSKKGHNQTFYLDIANGRRDVKDLEILCKLCNRVHYIEFKYGYFHYEVKWDNKSYQYNKRRLTAYEDIDQDVYVSEYNRNLRNKVLNVVGRGKLECARCSCNKRNILEINHMDGNGRKDGHCQVFFRNIISGKRSIDDLEILCRVCNIWHYIELKYGKQPFEVIWNE